MIKAESEIISTWPKDYNKPLVSICCVTYNHKHYLAQALDSFLMQETTFPFEIIIHDDASDDGTTDIVKKYEKNFPNIIRVLIQTDNQYSKQPVISPKFVWPLAKGQYIAMCEGDDFWTNYDKLQYQIEKMQEYPQCRVSFHNCQWLDNTGKRGAITDYGLEDKVYSLADVIRGGGGFMTTPSVVYNRSFIDNLPDWFCDVPVGDYYSQILASANGGALYLPKPNACYRLFTPGSWTLNEASHTLKNQNVTMLANRHTKYLMKLKNMLPQSNSKDIDFAIAYQLCRCATLALLNKDYQSFKVLIVKSWQYQKGISLKQWGMYRFRFLPWFLFKALTHVRKVTHK